MIAFRRADLKDSEERMFVVSTWAASFKRSKHAGIITSKNWPTVMHEQIGEILDRPTTAVILAVDSKVPGFFYGWIAGDKSGRVPIIHYAYVKESFRKWGYRRVEGSDPPQYTRVGDGIGRQLLAAFGLQAKDSFLFSCLTSAIAGDGVEPGIGPKIPRAKWDPDAARYEDFRRTNTTERRYRR